MMDMIYSIAIYVVPTILAITLHETAHGYAAKFFGDRTAELYGRLTLNPFAHVDKAGTIVIPLLLLAGSIVSGGHGMVFGWAKPVPVNFNALRNPKVDMIWVALAGPLSNLFQAILWAFALKFVFQLELSRFLLDVAYAGVTINLVLMAFNLIPILPLDGGRILTGLLPDRLAYLFSKTENYGLVVMIVLIATGMTGFLIRPFLRFGESIINWVF